MAFGGPGQSNINWGVQESIIHLIQLSHWMARTKKIMNDAISEKDWKNVNPMNFWINSLWK